MTTILLTVTNETKCALHAAVLAHNRDPRATLGLKRLRGAHLTLPQVIEVWPADADGLFRIGLTENESLIAWRCYAIAEIATGRGGLGNLACYESSIGRNLVDDYDFVSAVLRTRGVAAVRKLDYTGAVRWVRDDSERTPSRFQQIHGHTGGVWCQNATTHEACIAVGLSLPGAVATGGQAQETRPTILFVRPSVPYQSLLDPEDGAALEALADVSVVA